MGSTKSTKANDSNTQITEPLNKDVDKTEDLELDTFAKTPNVEQISAFKGLWRTPSHSLEDANDADSTV